MFDLRFSLDGFFYFSCHVEQSTRVRKTAWLTGCRMGDHDATDPPSKNPDGSSKEYLLMGVGEAPR